MPAISPHKPYRVGRSRTGLGLFATKPIKKGAKIVRYFGPLLDSKKKKDDAIENKYLFELTTAGPSTDRCARTSPATSPRLQAERRIRRQPAQAQGGDPRHQEHRAGRRDQLRYGTDYFKAYLKPIGCKCDACEKKRKKQRAEARAEKARLKARQRRKPCGRPRSRRRRRKKSARRSARRSRSPQSSRRPPMAAPEWPRWKLRCRQGDRGQIRDRCEVQGTAGSGKPGFGLISAAGRYRVGGTDAADFPRRRPSGGQADAKCGGLSYSSLVRARIAAYLLAIPEGGPLDEHTKTAADRHRFRRGMSVVLYRQAPDRERAGADAGRAGRDQLAAVLPQRLGPREGIGRDEYLTAKFGSVEAYKGIAGRVVAAASEEGLTYRPELVKRQPNTTDCHRLIHWADASGKSAAMKQRLMELYFRDGGDLTDTEVLVQAAADCGLDAGEVRRRLSTDEDVALISAQARDASDKGISGVPTFVSRRNTRCPARSRPSNSPAPSARSRRK